MATPTDKKKPKPNQRIQQELSLYGKNVNYREAQTVAQSLGVSVDRVYNQTAKTGQTAVAGTFAANAGYVPSEQLKVASPITQQYASQVASNAAEVAKQNPAPPSQDTVATSEVPQFDWQAWNAQMAAQQAAIWESMDAMNAEFLRKQEDYFAQRDSQTAQPQSRNGLLQAGGIPADKASVKRKRRTSPTSTSAASTGLNTSSSAPSVSLGGGQTNSGGLSIGKG